jgi:hypothetical protein
MLQNFNLLILRFTHIFIVKDGSILIFNSMITYFIYELPDDGLYGRIM